LYGKSYDGLTHVNFVGVDYKLFECV
jgi:hypothetical protein